jgi:hypothetical protein
MKINHLKLALLGCGILLMVSCKKEESDNDTLIAKDFALGENATEDLQSIADQAQLGDLNDFKSGNDLLAGNCATITRDTLSNPKTMTIDFGPTNCLGNDGRLRRGVINVTYTGKYRDPGTVITITTQDYYVNNNKIIGTRVITNQGPNSLNQMVYNVTVNCQIEKANGAGTAIHNATKTRSWIEGFDTPQWNDDVYLVEGTVNGTSAAGVSFTATTLSPLRRQIGCKWFTEGKVEINKTGKPSRIIDFGNGNCDNEATVTINGNVYNITLP